jgi:hypothetical protein
MFLLFGLILVLSYQLLQQTFDDSDIRKSISAVQGDAEVVEAIERRHNDDREGPVAFSGELVSGCYGATIVHADVKKRDGQTIRYDFQVDLNETPPAFRPANGPAEEVFTALKRGGGGNPK